MKPRQWLTWGAVLTATGAVGGSVLWWAPAWTEEGWSASGRSLLQALAAAMLEGMLPQPAAAQDQALSALTDRAGRLIGQLPAHSRLELLQLLGLLLHPAGRLALAGLAGSWSQASTEQVRRALQAMRLSGLPPRQQAYQALHSLVVGAYFADPASWPALGYPGPRPV